MSFRRRAAAVAGLSFAVVTSLTVNAVKFTSTWAAPEAGAISFAGKKVAAIAMTDDLALRMSTEEALARELTAKKITALASYRIIPGEELKNPERARAWFQRDQVAGAVVVRAVSNEKVPRYAPDIWVSSYYSSFWGYYPYAWSGVYVPGPKVGSDTLIVVESLVYDVSTGKLVWGGVSEATNPKNLQTLVADIVSEASKMIEKRFRN
jgi:hypothetical protein